MGAHRTLKHIRVLLSEVEGVYRCYDLYDFDWLVSLLNVAHTCSPSNFNDHVVGHSLLA